MQLACIGQNKQTFCFMASITCLKKNNMHCITISLFFYLEKLLQKRFGEDLIIISGRKSVCINLCFIVVGIITNL